MGESFEAIVIGASAGGMDALTQVLSGLPKDFSLPIIIVVHIPPDKKSLIAEILSAKCRVQVKEADDKESIVGGTAYIAPPDYHLLIEKNKTLSLSSEEPVLFSRPSIDVLFESAADAYGETLLAIILTGANNDGAKGLKAVEEAGGVMLVQNSSTAYATAMPSAAVAACDNAQELSLNEISIYIQKAANL